MESFISSVVTIALVMDGFGNIPLFIAALKKVAPERRKVVRGVPDERNAGGGVIDQIGEREGGGEDHLLAPVQIECTFFLLVLTREIVALGVLYLYNGGFLFIPVLILQNSQLLQ